MDLNAWRQATRARLLGLTDAVREMTPGMAYGALCSASLLPVVTAANGGDFTALVALSGVVGGVGGNLIANQIQTWKDRSDEELAVELTTLAREDAQWRETLDTLLAELETPRVVQAILSEADRDWFAETLRAGLAEVGSGLKVSNDGTLVVGDRNIVGDVSGSVIQMGDQPTYIAKAVIQLTDSLGQSLGEKGLSATESETLTQRYLEFLLERYRYLDFRGMGMADRVALQLPLTGMYVPLKARIELPKGDTWARDLLVAGRKVSEDEVESMGERLSEPRPVVDLLKQYDGLIILGDPGAGKTTFLKYLAVTLAMGVGAALGLDGRLPILVPLSAYANAIDKHDKALPDFLGDYYKALGIPLAVGDLLDAALDEGRALVMLDGLDEVQDLAQRMLVLERVFAFFAFHRKPGNKFLLTSRIVGYKDVRGRVSDGMRECTLADFDDSDINDFVDKWTVALERAIKGETKVAERDAAAEKAALLDAVSHNAGVRNLAANPLLLTILALMKRQGVELPERRVELYEKYVATMLRHWNLARGLDGRRVGRDLDVLETTRVLAPLALWMHETSPGVGLVKAGPMRRRLEAIYRERNFEDPEGAAGQLLADAREHASLLLERGPGEFGFIHLTFQEYLAGVAIAQQEQIGVDALVARLAQHLDDDSWHETLLLAVGHLGIIQQRDVAAGEALLKLMAQAPGKPGAVTVLAGEAVLDAWPGGVTLRCKQAVVDALLKAMLDDGNVDPTVRAWAGSLLGALGDLRDLDEMVPVSGGRFTMGEGKEAHRVTLPAFRMAKYPVTNGQYAAFVAAGYRAPIHWTAGKPPKEKMNHPVVNVTWRDAMAYCKWLSEERGEEVRLPSEAEWERAAKGDRGNRRYPWGDDVPDANRCNFDNNIRTTTPVGIYPAGDSLAGCCDMSGNALEWTRSRYADYPYDAADGREDVDADGRRVLRGGAFNHYQYLVRCASRYGLNPYNWYDHLGFRVLAPGL